MRRDDITPKGDFNGKLPFFDYVESRFFLFGFEKGGLVTNFKKYFENFHAVLDRENRLER